MKWSIVDQLRDKLCWWCVGQDIDGVAGCCMGVGWRWVHLVVPVGRGLDHWEGRPEGRSEGRGGSKFWALIAKRSGELFALEKPPPGGEKPGEQEGVKGGKGYLLRQPRPLRWSSWPTRPHLPPRRE